MKSFTGMWKILVIGLGLSVLSGCLSKNPGTPYSQKPQASIEDRILTKELFDGGFARNGLQAVFPVQDELWVATSHGLYVFGRKDLEERRSYLKDQKILDIARSSNGTIFVALEGQSMMVLPPGETMFYAGGTPPVRRLAIQEGSDQIWGATASGLISWENGSTFRTRIDSPSEFASQANDVTSLAFDRSGNLWIGTQFGIYRKNGSSFSFFYGNYQIVQGLSVVNKRGNSPLGGNYIYDVALNPADNAMLFATNGGLSVLRDPQKPEQDSMWQVYTGDHTTTIMNMGKLSEMPVKGNSGLPSNFIRSVTAFQDFVFAGTDSGLAILNQGKFTTLTLDNGLAGDTIMKLFHESSIEEDRILVATNGGLSILNYPRKALSR